MVEVIRNPITGDTLAEYPDAMDAWCFMQKLYDDMKASGHHVVIEETRDYMELLEWEYDGPDEQWLRPVAEWIPSH